MTAEIDAERWRDAALALADLADPIAMRWFGGQVAAAAKADGTPVTEADRAIESALRARLAEVAPDHLILGEEQGGHLDPAVPTWVIDPIDATKNFMRGVPVFATLIGLAHRGEVVVGVASAPALGERWDAFAGGGARRNGEAVAVSGVAALADAHLLVGGLGSWRGEWERLGRLVDAAWRVRGFGDFWMHLLVAGGMAEAAVEEGLKPWDVAAVIAIVREAGGRATAWDGTDPLAGGSLLCTNGLLHAEVAAHLA